MRSLAARRIERLAFYGWREGAAHQFYGPNNVPDLWPIKKVSPQSMVHLTEKPVELAARDMQFSTTRNARCMLVTLNMPRATGWLTAR